MGEAFLKEQLKRIRELTEHMTRVQNQASEVSAEVARERDALRHGPLQEVRDFRPYSPTHEETRNRANDHAVRNPRPSPRQNSRRRR